jgi:hypothetical protein
MMDQGRILLGPHDDSIGFGRSLVAKHIDRAGSGSLRIEDKGFRLTFPFPIEAALDVAGAGRAVIARVYIKFGRKRDDYIASRRKLEDM